MIKSIKFGQLLEESAQFESIYTVLIASMTPDMNHFWYIEEYFNVSGVMYISAISLIFNIIITIEFFLTLTLGFY